MYVSIDSDIYEWSQTRELIGDRAAVLGFRLSSSYNCYKLQYLPCERAHRQNLR